MTKKNKLIKNKSIDITKTVKTDFTSEIDRFFHEFDLNRTAFPLSRLEEIKKAQIIADKRDKS